MFDLVIIGSGPGGYVAAIKAAQLGLKVAIVEKDSSLGGTCLNVGCIPSKALLESSEHFAQANLHFKDHGLEIKSLKINLKTMMQRKTKIVKELTDGIKFLMSKNKITVFNDFASLHSATEIKLKNTKDLIKTKNILIATGSTPKTVPSLNMDQKFIISSSEALSLQSIPKTMNIIGAGVIGLELGSVWARLGTKVNIIEYNKNIAGSTDLQVSKKLKQLLIKQGLNIINEKQVISANVKSKKVEVQIKDIKTKKIESLSSEVLLVAIGRQAFTKGLNLKTLGIELDDKGFIPVSASYQTKIHSIYAIGDVVGGAMLAHKAEEEGLAVVENIAGHKAVVKEICIPSVIYTDPEVASVGFTEEELKINKVDYKKGSFPFAANGRAKALGSTEGFVKILSHKKTDKILGVHIIGAKASELIGEAVLCMELAASTKDLATAFHAHPTLSESIKEAALAVDNKALHI